nr:hypothetical protein [Bifidobacterium lemurum]
MISQEKSIFCDTQIVKSKNYVLYFPQVRQRLSNLQGRGTLFLSMMKGMTMNKWTKAIGVVAAAALMIPLAACGSTRGETSGGGGFR